MRIWRFLRGNYMYFIWFAFYFTISWVLLGENWWAFKWASIIYGVSITLALSPLGEILLRWMNNIQPVQTSKDREYLLPLFEEVYQKSKEKFPKLRDNIKLYVDGNLYANAFAIGRRTIAVTRGAVSALSRDELKGVLAHEFGHLVNGDTKASLLNVIGNGFFTLTVLALRVVLGLIGFIISLFEDMHSGSMDIIFIVFKFCVDVYIYAITLTGQLLLSLNRRQKEYYADYFAYEIGYADELIRAFYLFQKTSIPANVPLLKRLQASHPNMSRRIARLEKLQEVA